jgi:hypothetical protein
MNALESARRVQVIKALVEGTTMRIIGIAKHIILKLHKSLGRQNLTMRLGIRRFTRLKNGFSKKVENHGHAVALHFVYYNFSRVYKTLRVTPAMEAGIADHIWTIEEVVGLLPESVQNAA